MSQLSKRLGSILGRRSSASESLSDRQRFYREWEIQREHATGPSDLAEIDAIFSRHDREWDLH